MTQPVLLNRALVFLKSEFLQRMVPKSAFLKRALLRPCPQLLMCALLAAHPLQAVACNSEQGGILVLGDSLSAAYGMEESEGWVALLRQRLAEQQLRRPVINASVSGETSSGGTARLPPLLDKYRPGVVILELGGNDGLRGYPVPTLRAQLQQAIDLSQQQGARVLLVGMQIPPNYGARYSRMFSETYPTLAKKNQLPLVPFLLDGVAGLPDMIQPDGIHPTAAGQPQMLDNVWPVLRDLLATLPAAYCSAGQSHGQNG